ncbi:MAG: hypothetical protein LC737_01810 [Chloroflexi bacterium]|nr:hypothetical protein [Chloroflexota bacterium]
MKQIDPKLEQRLCAHPQTRVRLIVRTNMPPADCAVMLADKGLRVVRTSSLINALTVEGTAKDALALCDEDWVVHVEEDKPVHIQ